MEKPMPKCPICPSGRDHGIIVARTRKAWYCCICGRYFEQINGITPHSDSLRELLVLEEEEFRWTAEELAAAKDRPVATFYSLLNDADRRFFAIKNISLYGDERFPKEIPNEENTSPLDIVTHRDTI